MAIYCDYFLRLAENGGFIKSYPDFITFCCNFIAAKETNFISSVNTIKEDYPKVIIKQLINATRLESYEARQRFPRLLQIIELYPESVKLFIEEV